VILSNATGADVVAIGPKSAPRVAWVALTEMVSETECLAETHTHHHHPHHSFATELWVELALVTTHHSKITTVTMTAEDLMTPEIYTKEGSLVQWACQAVTTLEWDQCAILDLIEDKITCLADDLHHQPVTLADLAEI